MAQQDAPCTVGGTLIGVAGGACTGKSTLAQLLADKLGAEVLSLDEHFHDPNTFPRAYGHPDYDRYEAIDWDRAAEELGAPAGTMVVEGFLLLANEELRGRLDISFYVECDTDELIRRRLVREPETVPEYITRHIRQQHEELVVPTSRHATHLLDGNLPLEELAATAVELCRRRAQAE